MKQRLLFISSRIFLLSSIIIFQLVLSYKINNIEFAYISFGFSMLSIAIIAYSFGFNQTLMYQFSRGNSVSLNELFSKLFKVFLLNSVTMSCLIFAGLQFYAESYLQYGLIFTAIAFLLSLRDYINIPFIIQQNYRRVSISNFLTSLPFYLATIITLFYIEFIPLYIIFSILIVLLIITLTFYDLQNFFLRLTTNHTHTLVLLQEYKKTFAFGISVFLFTIYYQLSNILLPILEEEQAVATFGVVFIYLGSIYTLLNIVFNQIVLPNMYNTYKKNHSLYLAQLKRHKLIFTISGLFVSAFSLLVSNLHNTLLLQPIMLKYPEFFNGIAIVSLGILSRYIATVYSGNMNVIGWVSLKIKIQLLVTLISFIITYYLIFLYSFKGACMAYSLTETLLLLCYLYVEVFYVRKA